MASFTHLDASGNPSMVDVGDKTVTHRVAVARSIVHISDEIMALFQNDEIQTQKGPVFQTAIIAGVMAAKKTGDLIPLCHPIGMDNCQIKIKVTGKNTIEIICEASVNGKTGIEMEALTGASVAALTIYDMCKALSHDIVIKETRLIKKTGGKKDFVLNEKV
ncbi:MAG: cyclic pyranopterin monophosphate synthase MoaC [Cytophagaceae bacterium]|nr:cyclic pyranopterin monophosphate synthase MoaC [Cytophagaceae bacterium]MBK9935435.1 cyclic pyranopterin monophosphate synthase MoaC [Cytophagaceae bacterium]MBL0301878.1 cyclic pyranopterin monophosphate synthase MoaC [Cytophagaceae bacterium]MBL0324705.1 cyclic pyranopterin monophosphate synthase MoaC [Cytophagaceae bacterium]